MSVPGIRLAEAALINPRLRDRPDVDAPVSFLRMADVDAEGGTTTQGDERRFGDVAKGYTQFADLDILIAKITPCFENGKIAQARLGHRHGSGSTEFHVVRPNRSLLDDRFLLRFLRQPRVRISGEKRMTGSGGQRRVPEAFLADLTIPLLPLAEQKEIAQLLDRVDELRAQRRRAIVLLDDLARAVFVEMFGDPSVNPMGWERVPMQRFLARIESGRSPRCLDRPAAMDEWGVLKLGAVTRCEYRPGENKAMLPNDRVDERNAVQAGDLLLSRKNTPELVAAAAYVRETRGRLLLPDLIYRLVPRSETSIDKVYLHGLLTFPTKRRKLQGLASGSAASMPNISKGKLLDFECEVPPIGLQREYANRIGALADIVGAHRTHLAELDALFASLQHRAFRGELWAAPAV